MNTNGRAQTVTERLSQWNAFVEKRSGPFMFRVEFPWPEREAKLPPAPLLWPDYADARIERRWAEYEFMRAKVALVDDDRVR